MSKLINLIFISSLTTVECALRGASSKHTVDRHRNLAGIIVPGECTVANFSTALGGDAKLATYLGSSSNNVSIMQGILDTKCANALKPTK